MAETAVRPGRRIAARVVGLAVVLALVAGLVLATRYADRLSERKVEQETAARLQSELGTPTAPSVDVEGHPFLTQVAAGSIKTVRISADGIGVTTDAAFVVEHVDLVLSDITTSDFYDTMTVSHAEGTARVTYGELASLAHVPLVPVGQGRVRIDPDTQIFGVPIKIQVVGGLGLDPAAQTISLTQPQITVAGVKIPEATSQAVLRAILKPISIGGLPYGLNVSAIRAADDAVYADVMADEIPVTR